ncbi:MAG: hypothetical protein ACYSUI_13550, partial [Planctomycetota bacterium]
MAKFVLTAPQSSGTLGLDRNWRGSISETSFPSSRIAADEVYVRSFLVWSAVAALVSISLSVGAAQGQSADD